MAYFDTHAHLDADEFEGPGLEGCGLGGAVVEGAFVAEANLGPGQGGEALHEAAEGLQGQAALAVGLGFLLAA